MQAKNLIANAALALSLPAFYAVGGYLLERFNGIEVPLITYHRALLGVLYWLSYALVKLIQALNKPKLKPGHAYSHPGFLYALLLSVTAAILIFILCDRFGLEQAKKRDNIIEELNAELNESNRHALVLLDSVTFCSAQISELEEDLKKCGVLRPKVICRDTTKGTLQIDGDRSGYSLEYNGVKLATTDQNGYFSFLHCNKGINKSCKKPVLVDFIRSDRQFQSKIFLCIFNKAPQ